MSIASESPITIEQLLASAERGRFEIVDGQLEEVHVSNMSSAVAFKLGNILGNFCEANRLGLMLGADGYYVCFGESHLNARKPDVSFISGARITPGWLDEGYSSIPPDLAVEVLSPNDKAYEVNQKIKEYLEGGVRLIWVIDPAVREVMVYRANGSTQRILETDSLSGEDVLPGFTCEVRAFLLPAISHNPSLENRN